MTRHAIADLPSLSLERPDPIASLGLVRRVGHFDDPLEAAVQAVLNGVSGRVTIRQIYEVLLRALGGNQALPECLHYDADTKTLTVAEGVTVRGANGLTFVSDGHLVLDTEGYSESSSGQRMRNSVLVNTRRDDRGRPIIGYRPYAPPPPLRGAKGRRKHHACGR